MVATHAALFEYTVTLDGPSEAPANTSPGTGSGIVDYDSAGHTLHLAVSFSGLTGNVTASHIHAPTPTPLNGTAGVATTTPTFADFPSGVTSGTYDRIRDLTAASSYNPAFITANGGTPASAEAALAAALAGGEAYWNIHTSAFPGGEIRGFLVPTPEPSTLALGALGAAGLAFNAWSRRSRGQKK
ncbi:MAG: CHRD domain-containing protein [Verrucomicrobiota bacterium]